jgi:hypothetical protein
MSHQNSSPHDSPAIELRGVDAASEFQDLNEFSSAAPSLPEVDGGYAAWLFLFGSFLIETFLWGKLTPLLSKPTDNHSKHMRRCRIPIFVRSTAGLLYQSPSHLLGAFWNRCCRDNMFRYHVSRSTVPLRKLPKVAELFSSQHIYWSANCCACRSPFNVFHKGVAFITYSGNTVRIRWLPALLPCLHLH